MSVSFRKLSRRTGRRLFALRIGWLRWQNLHLPQSLVLILIAFAIGAFTGLSAAAIKNFVGLLNNAILTGVKIGTPSIRFLIWPLAGILITSIYQRYVAHSHITTGTRLIRKRLDSHSYRFGVFDIFNPIIGCSMTMGLGASAGTEGPTALSGAAIGSCIGQLFRLSRPWLRLLVGIGAGAGIAAIFKSPMGGVLFTLEVLQMQLTSLPVLALIIACLVASGTAYLMSDFTFDISFVRDMPMDPKTLGWVALLGLFCGLYSVYYSYTKTRSAKLFGRIRNPWIGAVATGATLSICVFMIPALFGEGFDVITDLVNGRYIPFTEFGVFAGHSKHIWLFLSLGGVLLLKGILVAASYSNGGVAGDFVPTFFAGAVAGAFFAFLINDLCGTHLHIWYFALIGMGCVMAGTINAPLMSLFILCETTNTYAYIFPYMIAIAVSYFTVKVITPRSLYGEAAHDDLMALLQRGDTPDLRSRVPGPSGMTKNSASQPENSALQSEK